MSKKLIAYFSASGTTKKVAEMISHLDSLSGGMWLQRSSTHFLRNTTSQARRSHCSQHRAEADLATLSRNSSHQHRELSL